MKRIIAKIIGGFVVLTTICYMFSPFWSIFVIFLGIISIIFIFCFIIGNRLLKKTNWWKNKFIYTNKLVSNIGYRTYTIRNLDVVNVGSNPALFAFFYENVLGENWSTGTQGLNMDFEILKYRYSFIKKGGTVILPLVLFSSISEYLNTQKGWRTPEYYVKYFKAIDHTQLKKMSNSEQLFKFYKYPLLFNWKYIKYIFKDIELDRRMEITSQTMSKAEFIHSADLFINGWKTEFNIKNLKAPINKELIEAMNETVVVLRKIIDFVIDRELTPILVFPPMSEELRKKIPEETFKYYVTDFLNKLQRPNVPFLNYFNSTELSKSEYFFNALYMNLKGRKKFTKRVLKDLTYIK